MMAVLFYHKVKYVAESSQFFLMLITLVDVSAAIVDDIFGCQYVKLQETKPFLNGKILYQDLTHSAGSFLKKHEMKLGSIPCTQFFNLLYTFPRKLIIYSMIFRFHLPGIFQQKMFFLFFFLQRASPFRRNIIVHIIRCLRHSVHCSMMLPNTN